ncbi:Zinc finger protein 721, partial [Stegodyphus mimosarum]
MVIHTRKNPHICEVCRKSFRKKCKLNLHMLLHTGEKPHVCEVCNKLFRQM